MSLNPSLCSPLFSSPPPPPLVSPAPPLPFPRVLLPWPGGPLTSANAPTVWVPVFPEPRLRHQTKPGALGPGAHLTPSVLPGLLISDPLNIFPSIPFSFSPPRMLQSSPICGLLSFCPRTARALSVTPPRSRSFVISVAHNAKKPTKNDKSSSRKSTAAGKGLVSIRRHLSKGSEHIVPTSWRAVDMAIVPSKIGT